MHRLFFRFFLGFVLVIALILGLESAVLVLSGIRQAGKWRDEIFTEYVEAFSARLDAYASHGIFSTERLESPLLGAAEDRVSGLLLRDAQGTLKFAYGKPDRQEARSKHMADGNLHEEICRAPIAVVAINQGFDGSGLTHSVEVFRDPDEKRTMTLPGNLEARDVTGTIRVVVNEEMVGSVDVLAFTPLGYRPTSRFVEGFLLPIASSMVVATLLALVLAWQMSKRNQRYIKGIQQALSDLAHGRHGVTLPQSKIVENLAINASIGDLDRRLEKNDASRREWLNSISHDLATPVTSMKLMLDGMVEGMFPLKQETMAGLKKECDDLAERIDRVVFYANLTSPTTKAELAPCDIAQMIEEVKQSLDEGTRERTCFIQKATTLVGDRKLLERAIGELVRNAAQASSEEISVCIGEGTITVMNDGILPPDTDFFEPWTKGDKSRTGGGNGLGLPIVGQILRLHQGSAHLSLHNGKVLASLAWPIA